MLYNQNGYLKLKTAFQIIIFSLLPYQMYVVILFLEIFMFAFFNHHNGIENTSLQNEKKYITCTVKFGVNI